MFLRELTIQRNLDKTKSTIFLLAVLVDVRLRLWDVLGNVFGLLPCCGLYFSGYLVADLWGRGQHDVPVVWSTASADPGSVSCD